MSGPGEVFLPHLQIFFPPSTLGHGSLGSSLGSFNIYFPILMSLMLLSPWTSDERGGEEAKMGILNVSKPLNSRSVPESGQVLDTSMCSGASSASTRCCALHDRRHTYMAAKVPLFLSPEL